MQTDPGRMWFAYVRPLRFNQSRIKSYSWLREHIISVCIQLYVFELRTYSLCRGLCGMHLEASIGW